ncbi:hypothetical protein HC891_25495 [Candidatus Gracilibacteria bacterium]|nr:hypothetical protein [Candidatus Gracilibacteria bacterium]
MLLLPGARSTGTAHAAPTSFATSRCRPTTPTTHSTRRSTPTSTRAVEHFGLRPHLRLGCGVSQVEPAAGNGWDVTLADWAHAALRRRVVANGHHNQPSRPALPGVFAGHSIHSQNYRYREPYAGKRVVVVGFGNSGSQIAVDVSFAAEQTFLAIRRGSWLLPHYILGLPIHKVMTAELSYWLNRLAPWPLSGWLLTATYRLLLGFPERFGLPKPDHHFTAALVTISENLLNRIGDGRVQIKPNISQFDGNSVVFADGSRETVDAIIYCTGYQTVFPFLDPALFAAPENRLPLYKRIFLPAWPGLLFIGAFQANAWGLLPLFEAQAHIIAAQLAGTYALPSQAEMEQSIAQDAAATARRFVDSPRNHYMLIGPIYADACRRELARGQRRAARRYRVGGSVARKSTVGPRTTLPILVSGEITMNQTRVLSTGLGWLVMITIILGLMPATPAQAAVGFDVVPLTLPPGVDVRPDFDPRFTAVDHNGTIYMWTSRVDGGARGVYRLLGNNVEPLLIKDQQVLVQQLSGITTLLTIDDVRPSAVDAAGRVYFYHQSLTTPPGGVGHLLRLETGGGFTLLDTQEPISGGEEFNNIGSVLSDGRWLRQNSEQVNGTWVTSYFRTDGVTSQQILRRPQRITTCDDGLESTDQLLSLKSNANGKSIIRRDLSTARFAADDCSGFGTAESSTQTIDIVGGGTHVALPILVGRWLNQHLKASSVPIPTSGMMPGKSCTGQFKAFLTPQLINSPSHSGSSKTTCSFTRGRW